MVADGSIPSEPVITPDSSLRMSPNKFSVSTTSKLRGVFIKCIAQASTYWCLSVMPGYCCATSTTVARH